MSQLRDASPFSESLLLFLSSDPPIIPRTSFRTPFRCTFAASRLKKHRSSLTSYPTSPIYTLLGRSTPPFRTERTPLFFNSTMSPALAAFPLLCCYSALSSFFSFCKRVSDIIMRSSSKRQAPIRNFSSPFSAREFPNRRRPLLRCLPSLSSTPLPQTYYPLLLSPFSAHSSVQEDDSSFRSRLH